MATTSAAAVRKAATRPPSLRGCLQLVVHVLLICSATHSTLATSMHGLPEHSTPVVRRESQLRARLQVRPSTDSFWVLAGVSVVHVPWPAAQAPVPRLKSSDNCRVETATIDVRGSKPAGMATDLHHPNPEPETLTLTSTLHPNLNP